MQRRKLLKSGISFVSGALAASLTPRAAWAVAQPKERYFRKMENFDSPDVSDLITRADEFRLLIDALKRIKRVQRTVGYGNFNLISFDKMLKVAKRYASVESFTNRELDFLERLFYRDAARYGFYGAKVIKNLTDDIDRAKTVYIRGTGQRIFKGSALEKYKTLSRAVGDELVLTSGVRSLVKQFYLFMNKAARSDGNFSLASRSLAPPGYSFHAVGDFDVGQRGLGAANFTDSFADTKVYRRLVELGYLRIRYPNRNLLGVRFEPWHIRIA